MFHSKPSMKLTMFIMFPLLLLLCYGAGNIHCATVHENNEDLRALLDFQQGVNNDPNGALSNWTTSSHFCHWNGVTCTEEKPWRVRWLNLSGQNLAGRISNSVGNLTLLNYLDLSSNHFSGPLPILGGLQKLQYLLLNDNNLSGVIPDALANCSNLMSLYLSSNSLVGSIPRKLGQLSNLIELDFSSNLLVGSIPPQLGLLSNLRIINLASNQLEGSIPPELGQLTNVDSLILGGNRLSGEIPHAIFNLLSLKSLSLDTNMLGKALPHNIGELLPNLEQLTLNNNMFEGPIPASLGNAKGLWLLDLSQNNFTGQIPTSFGNLLNLTSLNLECNQLVARDNQDWEFLSALKNCTSLKKLSLAYNKLQGSLPKSIGGLSTSLQQLVLTGNSLSGQIPHSIGKFSALTRLVLAENYFNGTIEGWIEKLIRLQVLRLQSNNFTGPIPSSISNLTNLAHLSLSKNDFEGSIPASLGNILSLQYLDLSHNNLQGYIPSNFGKLQSLIRLDLSHNNLRGDITHIGSNLEQLETLDLSSNMLTGAIPDSLGQCRDLLCLQLDHNFLTGGIPTCFGNLTILSMLDLSHNNLSGTIPQSLNILKSLMKLDLSYNDLHGEVPRNGVFENTTAVSLEGNWGLCGGTTDLHMPSCPTISEKSEAAYYLIRVLIPIFGFMSLILMVYFLCLVKRMSSKNYLALTSLGENFLKVSYNDLAQATSNFSESNFIGRGTYGSVYRGKLKECKTEVAVKVFDLEMGGAEKSFLKECEVLRSIQHRNLLPIITACSTVDNAGRVFKALVYEFMANGSLDKWLHYKGDGKDHKPMSLTQRLSIGVNIADALDYLHHDCGRTTIHCDLKPSNILLDDDMNALLGDFGIASIYQDSRPVSDGSISSSLGVKGTIGYIAPEHAGGGRHASTSDDVYGFGIILMEMMTGRRPTDPIFKDEVSIVNFVGTNIPHGLFHVVDAHLSQECKGVAEANKASENAVQQCLVSVLQIALSCTNPVPSERISMKEVAGRLHAIQTSYVSNGKRV